MDILDRVLECVGVRQVRREPTRPPENDRTGAALAYLKAQGVNIGPLEAQLGLAQTSWTETLKEVPNVVTKITPLIKQQGAKTKGDISTYEKGVAAYLEEARRVALSRLVLSL